MSAPADPAALAEPAATGLRTLFDLVQAAGGQLAPDGALQLPPRVGTGTIRLLEPAPGLRLALNQCTLAEELTLTRRPDHTQPETLLLAFCAFGPAPAGVRHLSTVQITSSDLGFTSTLPAHTPIFLVGVAIEKSLLRRWLNVPAEPEPAMVAARRSVVLDALLTPELERVLTQFAAPPAPYLDTFFYRIRTQELLYWLFRELADRAAPPPRPLLAADVEKIFAARAALLAAAPADGPPRLAALARHAGLSETKLKQLFRQVFGTSPYNYFQLARLEEAKRLLAQLSVSEVGYRLGFTNLSHFARLFEKHHGLTPKKYQASRRR